MEKKIMKVIIKAPDKKTFTDLLVEYHLDIAGEHRDKDGKIVTEAYVSSKKIDQLRKPGIEIQVVEDATQTGLERQKEVSSSNRFSFEGQSHIKGLGKKE
jgi:hypothetical protein